MAGAASVSPLRAPAAAAEPSALAGLYRSVRARTVSLCAGLSAEDCQIQSAPQCSPIKWHLAHTTWFFDSFLLRPRQLATADELWGLFYNSYYHTIGQMTPRGERGLISRPRLDEVLQWREQVDEVMGALIERSGEDSSLPGLVRLGVEHERQHQELILMDIKSHFFASPGYPAYSTSLAQAPAPVVAPMRYDSFEGGMLRAGQPRRLATGSHDVNDPADFSFDSETPVHTVLLPAFSIAERLVTCGEYLAFIEDGGYQRVEFWFSDAWEWLQGESIEAPLYWVRRDRDWMVHTLGGLVPLQEGRPVSHLSYYEASAYALWAGARLPTEYELEFVQRREYDAGGHRHGNFMESGYLEPTGEGGYCGDLWEWTSSAFSPYPGFRPLAGSVGEYNGKFMVNQQVLKGAGCATPAQHFHPSRRNFYYPHERWMYSGLRLCAVE